MVAVLFLSNRHNVMMNNAVRKVDSGASGAARGTFFWIQVQGLFCAVILVGAMFDIEQFLGECDCLQVFLYQIIVFPALIIFIGQIIYSTICLSRNGSLVGEKII